MKKLAFYLLFTACYCSAQVPTLDMGQHLVGVCPYDALVDQFKVSATENELKFKWTPSIGLDKDDVLNPIVNSTEDRTYTLTITSKEGQKVAGTVNVLVGNTFFVANYIAVNTAWNIGCWFQYPNMDVKVYNSTGSQTVFQTSGGYYNHWVPKIPGTYLYEIDTHSSPGKLTGKIYVSG